MPSSVTGAERAVEGDELSGAAMSGFCAELLGRRVRNRNEMCTLESKRDERAASREPVELAPAWRLASACERAGGMIREVRSWPASAFGLVASTYTAGACVI